MATSIIGAIAAALGSVGYYFKWKTSAVRQRELAEVKVAEETAAAEAKKAEIRAAVYNNDDEKLNQIVNQLMED